MTPVIDANSIDVVPIPLLVIGRDKRVKRANNAFCNIFGRGLDGIQFDGLFRQPAILAAADRAIADQTVQTARYTLRAGPRDTLFHVTIGPIDQGLIVCFEDRSANEETTQMRREFVANVSHELRTPLTSLLGFIETLQGPARGDPAAQARFLAVMHTEAVRMARLVEDLLSLSRVEEDARMRPTDPVEIVGLIDAAVQSLLPQASAAQVKITQNTAQLLLTIAGDFGQLQQVFVNLIENGLKYGAGGKKLEIAISAPQYLPKIRCEGICVTVTDKGAGIADHHIARLTERFYRVDDHRSRAVGGTGLGLAIVKHIVNRHRGHMRIDSTLGQGTTVTVLLPIGAPQKKPAHGTVS